jgi:hypothetical protein
MKAAIAAVAVTAIALVAATDSAHAQTAISVQVATPHFGFRIGAPAPIFSPAPIYVPAVPIYVSPVPIMYAPARLIVSAPVVYPVVYPYHYSPAMKHRKHGYREVRGAFAPAVGYGYGPR